MQHQLKQIEDKLQGNIFIYQERRLSEKKSYKFIKAIIVAGKFRIDTETRSFVLHPSEVEDFLNNVQVATEIPTKMHDYAEGSDRETFKAVESHKNNYNAQMIVGDVVKVPEVVATVSDGLKAMFLNISSGVATEKQLSDARTASLIAGKLIDVEKIRLGYLILNNK